MFSLVIPVYKNEASLDELLAALANLHQALTEHLEVVFVVDGSPDRCFDRLQESLSNAPFQARLLLLSRNFGSFSAIRAGLDVARGPYFAVMAADLQEPPELVVEFFHSLQNEDIDVVIGTREARDDPWINRVSASLFWNLYRKFVAPDMPIGGVDVFGCNQMFRDQLLALEESHSSLIGLIFWLGFRRKLVGYTRQARRHGKSAWTLHKKINYLMDSVFAFSDLPIKVLIGVGGFGLAASLLLGGLALIARLFSEHIIPGYTATVLTIVFFSALNMFSLGLIGSYAWRAYENTKRRPAYVVLRDLQFRGEIS